MKNNFKKTKVLGLAALCALSSSLLGACGGGNGGGFFGDELIEEIDKSKTQIYVEIFNGGYGKEWLELLKTDFEKEYPQYQVMITPAKRDMYTISSAIQTGNGSADVYFTAGPMYVKDLAFSDLLVDLSDIYQEKAAEDETYTLKEKIIDSEIYEQAFSNANGTGIYCLPYGIGFTGIILDMDLFIEKGWCEFATASDGEALTAQGITYTEKAGSLYFVSSTGKTNYEANDIILSKGRDGKYGTYDDGQPTTMDDFEMMLAKIQASGTYNPFIFSTEQMDYVDNVTMTVAATYEGVSNFDTYTTSKGVYSRTGEEITYENGYKAYQMEGWEKGATFMHDYITRPDISYATEVKNNLSFEEAKNKFLAGYKIASSKNKAGAMLIEGPWWENEAKPMFEALGRTDASRAYGKRDYRYLIFPYMDGAYGLDGNGKGQIFTSYDEGLIFIDKAAATRHNSVDGAKLLVQYSCRDKYIQEVAKIGCYRPYKVDYSDVYEEMTPYVANFIDMISDLENVKIYARFAKCYTDPFMYYGVGASTKQVLQDLASLYFYENTSRTVQQYLNAINPGVNTWNSYLESYRRATNS